MKSIRTFLMAASMMIGLASMAPTYAGKVEDLEAMLLQMQAQIDQMKIELAEAKAAAQTAAAQASETPDPVGDGFAEGVSVGGLIQLQTSRTKGYTGAHDAENSVVAEASITIDAALNDWVAAGATFKAQEGVNGDALSIQRALIAMELSPVNVIMGRSDSVFGALETYMISDPMTLSLAETAATMVRLEAEHNGFGGGIHLYNGDANKVGENANELNHYGADLNYAWESGDFLGNVGVGWIANIADSGGGANVVAARRTAMVRNVPAYTIHGGFETGPFSMLGEYIRAGRNFDAAELAFNGRGARPSAWNLEGAYAFEGFGVPAGVALGLGGTGEAAGFGLAKRRITGTVSFEVAQATNVALEWLRQDDYGTGDTFLNNAGTGTGSGQDQDIYTLQVEVEF